MSTKPNPLEEESERDLEVMEPQSAMQSITKAETDIQIATAKKYPRSIKAFIADTMAMVTRDPETAGACFYRLERKDPTAPNGIKVIEGPSIRLLEIAAAAYGNIRYGARIIEEGEKFLVAQGIAFDIQKNVYSSTEVRRRITTKQGARYGDDMIVVTANAACSIAKRNALNGIVPRVYIQQFMEEAKKVAIGDAASLSERRDNAVNYFITKLGIKMPQILKKLGRTSVEEINLEDLERLTGIKTALKDGDSKIEEEFPADAAPAGNPLKAGEEASAKK